MSFTISQLLNSQTGNDTSRDLVYVARGNNSGTDTSNAAAADVYAAAPATYNGLPKSSVGNIKPTSDQAGELSWEVTVRYANTGIGTADPGNQTLLSFSTTGGTKHLTQSIATTDWTSEASADDAPNFKGAIGVTDSGVTGVDIEAPAFNFRLRKKYAPAEITLTLINALYRKTPTVNNATWTVTVNLGPSVTLQLTFPKWAVKFIGAEASEPAADGSMIITFNMAAGLNDDTFTLVSGWPTMSKSAWDYLWVYYRKIEADAIGTSDKWLSVQPIAGYIEQVYYDSDFTAFGLPA